MSTDNEIEIRAEKLRSYLIGIIEELNTKFTADKQLNVNFLSNEPNNYSLDKIPTQTEVETWIIVPTIHRDIYSFRSRMNYSADTITNIKNIGFFESFEQIITNKNNDRILPDITGIQEIKCLNCGTMRNANTNTAEFDIQVMIEYVE